MKTYLLTWNPAKWAFQDWPQALSDMEVQGFYVRQWSCVNSHVVPGDAVLLKKTGKGLTGIIASGVALSAPFENRHWGKGRENTSKQYVQVRFDRLAEWRLKAPALQASSFATFTRSFVYARLSPLVHDPVILES